MALRIRRRLKRRTYRRAGGKYRLKRRRSRRYRSRGSRYRRSRLARIRRYKRRRYKRRVRGWYRKLRPSATRQDSKIHRHCGSMRWIEHFAPCLAELDRPVAKGDLAFSLVAKIGRMRTTKALNALTCLVTRVPYIRYSDTPDRTKNIVRELLYLLKLHSIQYTHDRLEPGAIYAEKMARIQLNKQALSAMESMLQNVPLVAQGAVSRAKQQALNFLRHQGAVGSRTAAPMSTPATFGQIPQSWVSNLTTFE